MKKFILSLFLGFVGIIGFGYCTDVSDLIQKICPNGEINCSYYGYVEDLDSSWQTVVDFGTNLYDGNTICVRFFDFSEVNQQSDVGFGFIFNDSYLPYQPSFYNNHFGDDFVCVPADRYLKVHIVGGYSPVSFYFEMFVLNDLLSTSLPKLSSLECQTEYNLISISEVDSGYCISNDLCPVFSGNNFSELIINDIVHESAPLINISIPQEYSRDYSVNENEFTLDISGYNVDYEYIDGIIKTQNSKPTVEDFNKIISELLPLFVPGLVIVLFLIFVFRFVKKVF